MSLRTKSESWLFDTRSYGRVNQGNWTLSGGTQILCNNSVTSDYPQWDYRYRISRGLDCTTSMIGTRSGFAKGVPPENLKKFKIKPILPSSIEGMDGHLMTYSLVSGKPTTVNHRYMKGNAQMANLTLFNDPSLFVNVDNQALSGFLRKLSNARREMQSLVSLGELPETIHLFRAPLRNLRAGLDRYIYVLKQRARRNRKQEAAVLLRIASDTWLEYSFGLAPLFNDVDGALHALAQVQYHHPPRRYVKYTHNGLTTQRGNSNVTTDYASNIRIRRMDEVRGHYCSVKYYGQVRMASADIVNTAARFGVTESILTNVYPTLYELIPYSWLLDYFTNVGGIIEAACNLNGDVAWVSRGVCHLRTAYWGSVGFEDLTSPPVRSQWMYRFPGSKVYRFSYDINRGKYVGTLLPAFQFRIPNKLSQLLNIVAIGTATEEVRKYARNG